VGARRIFCRGDRRPQEGRGGRRAPTAKIAFANLADLVECDEDGRLKVNEDGQLQLRSDLTREDLEAISTITVNDGDRVSWSIDRGPALKALRELLHPTKSKVELTGANDAPLFDLTKLSDDDLATLERILEAITGSSGAGQGGGGDRRIRTNAPLFCPLQEKRQTVAVARLPSGLVLGSSGAQKTAPAGPVTAAQGALRGAHDGRFSRAIFQRHPNPQSTSDLRPPTNRYPSVTDFCR
jgi:hypothetical protein